MANRLSWMSTDDIIKTIPCSCVDGRTPGIRYSVAGGSLGLVAHVLAALERQHGHFSAAQVLAYLQLFARQVGPLYLHSDQHAMAKIWAKMSLAEDSSVSQLNEEQQDLFLHLAIQADYQGCGHVKLMLLHAPEYQVRAELLQLVLQQFFVLYFSGEPRVVFDVLAGEHVERQVLLLIEQHQSAVADSEQQSALYREEDPEDNKFFCHRPLKRRLITLFADAIKQSELLNLCTDQWQALALEHDQAAERTLGYLAPHLPVTHLKL